MSRIQKIIAALDNFDALPFGQAGKMLDLIMMDAEAALKERDALLAALKELRAADYAVTTGSTRTPAMARLEAAEAAADAVIAKAEND